MDIPSQTIFCFKFPDFQIRFTPTELPTVICVVYVDDCIFWARSQSEIDNVMKSFKEDGPSYNWEHSKVESVYEFLGIDIKTLDNDEFQFCQTGLIRKVLEATGMEHCNGFPTPTKFESPVGTEANSSEAKRDWPKLICFCYRNDVVFSIKHKTRYILCCSPMCPVYT